MVKEWAAWLDKELVQGSCILAWEGKEIFLVLVVVEDIEEIQGLEDMELIEALDTFVEVLLEEVDILQA